MGIPSQENIIINTIELHRLITSTTDVSLEDLVDEIRNVREASRCIGKLTPYKVVHKRKVHRGYQLSPAQAIVIIGGLCPDNMAAVIDQLLSLEHDSQSTDRVSSETYAAMLGEGKRYESKTSDVKRKTSVISAATSDADTCIRALERFKTTVYGPASCDLDTFTALVQSATNSSISSERIKTYILSEIGVDRSIMVETAEATYIHLANISAYTDNLLHSILSGDIEECFY